jgi:hypothetical protein
MILILSDTLGFLKPKQQLTMVIECMQSISIFKLKVDHIPFKGECLFYEVINNETGEVHQGGVVSLDLKWISPSSMMHAESNNWYKVSYYEDVDEYKYFTKLHARRTVSSEVINAVLEVIAERELLGKDGI